MTQQELLIVMLGLVAIVGLSVIAYSSKTRKGELSELAWMFQGVLTQFLERADVTLAPHGEKLRPAHSLLEYLESLVDEPTDWLIEQLAKKTGTPAADIIALLQPPLQRGVNLTDGVPLPEREATPAES